VNDPDLSPLDLTIAPNGNIVVSSEHPFGAPDSKSTVREYDRERGHLVRVLSPGMKLQNLRGLRFGRDDHLYCIGRDEIVAFDFKSGEYLGTVARLTGTGTRSRFFQ
jgi:hypothetical protein